MQNRLIDWSNDCDIRLLEKSTLSGKHADLYSHTLFLDLKSENMQLKYVSVNGRRSESNKPKIELELDNETIILCYEPDFNPQDCAFVIEYGKTQFDNTSEFQVLENKLVYTMNKTKVAEEYESALKAISKILKTLSV